jgi:hypothetical protein
MRRVLPALLLVVAAGAYAGMLWRNISYAAAGSDASGYLNEGVILARGERTIPNAPLALLHLDASWAPTFAPLGFNVAKDARFLAGDRQSDQWHRADAAQPRAEE